MNVSAHCNRLYKCDRVSVIFIRTQIFSILCCPVLRLLTLSLQVHCKFKVGEHVLGSACPQYLQYWVHEPNSGVLVGVFLIDLTQSAKCSGFLIDNKHVF